MADKAFEIWLQSRLTSHNFPVGEIDGVIGAETTKALIAFQASRRLPTTGLADAVTVEALRATSTGTVPRPADPVQAVASAPSAWPRQAAVPNFYGERGSHLTSFEVPYDMVLAWDASARVKRITCHQLVADAALRVYQKTAGIYSAAERVDLGLNKFGGSFNIRKMRGGTSWSMHSWAIAFDHDPERNSLNTHKPKARLSQEDAVPFWEAWEAEGAVSLGRARDYDYMHAQFARL